MRHHSEPLRDTIAAGTVAAVEADGPFIELAHA